MQLARLSSSSCHILGRRRRIRRQWGAIFLSYRRIEYCLFKLFDSTRRAVRFSATVVNNEFELSIEPLYLVEACTVVIVEVNNIG